VQVVKGDGVGGDAIVGPSKTITPLKPLPRASFPPFFVPTRLPRTLLPVLPRMETPSSLLPEIRFRAAGEMPPTVVLDERRMVTPLLKFLRATVPPGRCR
jgi:hypothetical protein